MAKSADTEVLAGAALGTGFDAAAALKLVTSPKRRLLLDGMLETVGAEGYDRTSVRTVLDRTGVYRQAFYDNFADKDECYLLALESGIARFEAVALAAASGETTWRGQFRAGLGALLDLLDAGPDYGRGVIVQIDAAGPEAVAKRTEAIKRAIGFVDRVRADLGDDAPPSIAPEGVVAGIHSVVHARLAAGADGGFRELLPEFMYFAVMPFFGPEAANEAMQAR